MRSVVVIGDIATGKTTFIQTLTGRYTPPLLYTPTIGVDVVCYKDLRFFDTAGQERFQSITASQFKRADCVLIFYSCDNETSYNNVEMWINFVRNYTQVPYFTVCTKIDIKQQTNTNADFFINARSLQSIEPVVNFLKPSTVKFDPSLVTVKSADDRNCCTIS